MGFLLMYILTLFSNNVAGAIRVRLLIAESVFPYIHLVLYSLYSTKQIFNTRFGFARAPARPKL
jgi:hypothetical protein